MDSLFNGASPVVTGAVIVIAVLAVIFIVVLIKLLKTPLKWAFKILIHMLMGLLSLVVLNIVGASLGVELELSWFNALVSGVLGLPGVIILLIFKYL